MCFTCCSPSNKSASDTKSNQTTSAKPLNPVVSNNHLDKAAIDKRLTELVNKLLTNLETPKETEMSGPPVYFNKPMFRVTQQHPGYLWTTWNNSPGVTEEGTSAFKGFMFLRPKGIVDVTFNAYMYFFRGQNAIEAQVQPLSENAKFESKTFSAHWKIENKNLVISFIESVDPKEFPDATVSYKLKPNHIIEIGAAISSESAKSVENELNEILKDDINTANALTSTRLAWTGTAMRRAGFTDDQIKALLTKGGAMLNFGGKVEGDNIVAVAKMMRHILSLTCEGEVNDNGFNPPEGLSGVVAIDATDTYSVALKQDGTVVAWGECVNDKAISQIQKLKNVVAISAGDSHLLALKQDGTVVACQLLCGDDPYIYLSLGKVPSGLSGVVAIAAGRSHSLALKQDGTVAAWGCEDIIFPNNPNFKTKTKTIRTTDVGQCKVPSDLSDVVAIAASEDKSFALKKDGTIVSWGGGKTWTMDINPDGSTNGVPSQWGDSSDGYKVPSGLSGVVAIAKNGYLALKQDGTVVAWGNTKVPNGLTNVRAIGDGIAIIESH